MSGCVSSWFLRAVATTYFLRMGLIVWFFERISKGKQQSSYSPKSCWTNSVIRLSQIICLLLFILPRCASGFCRAQTSAIEWSTVSIPIKELAGCSAHRVADLISYLRSFDSRGNHGGNNRVKQGKRAASYNKPYVPHPEVASSIAEILKKRALSRASTCSLGAADKSHNPLVVLVGTDGAGKTATLMHLAETKEYQSYVKFRQRKIRKNNFVTSDPPVVSIVTFEDTMTSHSPSLLERVRCQARAVRKAMVEQLKNVFYNEDPEIDAAALGLRILYGTLRGTARARECPSWSQFYCKFGDFNSLSAREAMRILRAIYGEKRLFLVVVDQLSSVGNPLTEGAIIRHLGYVLSGEGGTDVIVSARTYPYIRELMPSGSRSVKYVPLPTFNHRELRCVYEPAAQTLVKVLKLALHKTGRALGAMDERLIMALDILAAGHPRTVDRLVDAIQNKTLISILAAQSSGDYTEIIYSLDAFECGALPSTEGEIDATLSVEAGDPIDEDACRGMLERGKCHIFERAENREIRAAINPPSFWRLMRGLLERSQAGEQLTFLQRTALKVLPESPLCALGRDGEMLQRSLADAHNALWVRFVGLSIVSRVWSMVRAQGMISTRVLFQANLRYAVGASKVLFFRELQVKNNLQVEVLQDSVISPTWKADTLLFMPPRCRHSDLLLCMRGRDGAQVYAYCATKVLPSQTTAAEGVLAKTLADRLRLMLIDHLKLCELSTKTVDEKLEALQNVYFTLYVYGAEWTGDTRAAVLAELEKGRGAGVEGAAVAIEFVGKYWNHVSCAGTTATVATMIPSVVPFAQMVQALLPEDDEEESMHESRR